MQSPVAPLEHEGESTGTRVREHPGENPEVARFEEHRTERVTGERILPCRHHHEVRLEPPDRRDEDLTKDQGVVGAGRARLKRCVDGVSSARAGTPFIRPACPGEDPHLVDRAVEHPVRCVERHLCSVAVVHVPVDDGDPVNLAKRPCRRDGGVVEEAEPHRPIGCGMVPRRADESKTVLAQKRPLHRLPCGSGRVEGRAEGTGGDVGVRVEVTGPARRALPAERADPFDISPGMHQRQVFYRRSLGGDAACAGRHPRESGIEACLRLGVTGRVMAGKEIPRHDRAGHGDRGWVGGAGHESYPWGAAHRQKVFDG